MTTVTTEEIEKFRAQLADNQEAITALDAIERCKGNLEAAAKLITIEQTDEDVETRADSNYLNELAKRCRNIICQEEFIDDLLAGLLSAAIASLTVSGNIPGALATPVVIYLAKVGVKKFCQSSEPKS
jgi:hypothetical protein